MTQSILVIDDDIDVREMLCRMLEQDGYEVILTRGGRDALERLDGLCPDLVITDVVMPEVDGIEVLLKLRLLAPKAEALVMSGGGRADLELSLEKARRLGARAVLRKPFTKAEMLEAVHQALASGNAPQPSTREYL